MVCSEEKRVKSYLMVAIWGYEKREGNQVKRYNQVK